MSSYVNDAQDIATEQADDPGISMPMDTIDAFRCGSTIRYLVM